MYYYVLSKKAKIVETEIISLFSSWVLERIYFCSCTGEREGLGGCGFRDVDKQFPYGGKTLRIETDPFSAPGLARDTGLFVHLPSLFSEWNRLLCYNCQPINSVGNLTMCQEVV